MSEKVSKNIFWMSLSRAAALVMLFAAYTRLFRYLGPESYGQYQFVLSYVLIFSTVVDFGIQQYITKKISENPEDKKKYFHNFLAFEAMLALVLYALLVGLAFFNGYNSATKAAIAVAGLGMVANALTYPFLAVMSAFQDLKKVALINFLNSLVNIAIIFLAIWLEKGIVFLASVQLAFGLLDLALYRIFIKKHLPRPDAIAGLMSLDFSLVRSIVASAWPFILLVGFSSIYNRIDVVIVARMLGYEATGYYGAAYKIFDLLAFFPAVVSHTLFPFFTGLMARGAVLEVKDNLEKYIRLMAAAALPMAVGGAILSPQIISLVAGPEFAPASPVLAVLIWAPAILFVYIPVNSLVISQLTRKAAAVTGANVAINIAGNILLLPRYGIIAAAAMTVLSEFLQGFFYFYFVRKKITGFGIGRQLLKPALSAAAMGAVLWQTKEAGLALNLPLGAAVYGGALWLSGFFSKQDLEFARRLVFNK